MNEIARTISRPELDGFEGEPLRTREWLVTNGLGGYASGRVLGMTTRRYHGILVAAMPAPLGRMVMLNNLAETLLFDDGTETLLAGDPFAQSLEGIGHIAEFRLDAGLPVWKYEIKDIVFEKRVILPHHQNTAHVTYRFVSGPGKVPAPTPSGGPFPSP